MGAGGSDTTATSCFGVEVCIPIPRPLVSGRLKEVAAFNRPNPSNTVPITGQGVDSDTTNGEKAPNRRAMAARYDFETFKNKCETTICVTVFLIF